MELFLGFVFTIAFSLLSSFCIALFLSIATTDDVEHDLTKIKTTHLQDESKDCNLETETRLGVGSETVDDQSSELFSTGVEKTKRKSLDEAQKTENEMGIDHKNKTAHFQEESKDCKSERETLDKKSSKLFHKEVEETEEKSVDEAQNSGAEMGLVKEEVGIEEKEEIEDLKSEIDCDEWEGIERSELERGFGAAVAYVGKNSMFSSDLKLQFYGLYQVAIAGPCLLPKPTAFKLSARAKWNAWQQLGNMSSEAAMEHYINLLSMNIPGWMEDNGRECGKFDYTHNE